MAKTANSYVPDQGEVVVTISAANVTAASGLTTAEDITIDGSVRMFSRTNDPQKSYAQTRVTGDVSPIVTRSTSKQEAETWELQLVDDYYAGETGEWGTDTLAAVEIFEELDDNDQDPGGLACTPAGGASANIEITLVNPKLLGMSRPETNADSTEPNEVTVFFACETSTRAAHG